MLVIEIIFACLVENKFTKPFYCKRRSESRVSVTVMRPRIVIILTMEAER